MIVTGAGWSAGGGELLSAAGGTRAEYMETPRRRRGPRATSADSLVGLFAAGPTD